MLPVTKYYTCIQKQVLQISDFVVRSFIYESHLLFLHEFINSFRSYLNFLYGVVEKPYVKLYVLKFFGDNNILNLLSDCTPLPAVISIMAFSSSGS